MRMKKITLSLMLISFSFFAFAQLTFDWEEQLINDGNNMKGMVVADDGTAILVGYGFTFETSSDNGSTWDHVPILYPEFNFLDLSINSSGTGYAITTGPKIVDNSSSYKEGDVYAEAVLLKTIDFGVTWTLQDIHAITVDGDETMNPQADGCYSRYLRAVEVLEDGTLYLSLNWYFHDATIGEKVSQAGFFKTTDGTTWTKLESGGFYSNVAEACSGNIVYYGSYNHLFKADPTDVVTDIYPALVAADGGSDLTIYINDVTIVSGDEIYVSTTSNGIFKTVDQGATFTELAGTGVPTGGNDFLKVNDDVWLVLGSSTKSKVTRDAGATWEGCYPGSTCYEIGGILGDSIYGLARGKIFAIATADLIAGTYTWSETMIKDGSNMQKMHVKDATNALIIGYGETVVSTADAGGSWVAVELPELFVYSPEYDFSSISVVGEASYAVSRRSYIVDFPSSAGVSDVYGHGLIAYSDDNWASWEMLDPGAFGDGSDPTLDPNADNCYGMSPTEIACINDTIAYTYVTWIDSTAGYADKVSHSNVFMTEDGGDSWVPLFEDLGNSYMNDLQFMDKDNGWVVGNTFLRKTEDGGATWIDMYPALQTTGSPDDSTMFLYEVDYVDATTWYVTTSTNGVFVTKDGGVNYAKLAVLGGASAFEVLNDTSLIALGSSSKSKISWDSGDTWTDCYPGSSVYGIGDILDESLVALCRGKIYKIPLADLEAPSREADVLTFVLAEQTGDAVIDVANNTIAIEVAAGTDPTALTPTITVSEGATVAPASEEAQDFTNPLTYTVTAEDQSTTEDWVVTVSIAVGVGESVERPVSMYPNPASNRLFVSNLEKVENISVYSISGALVYTMATPASKAVIELGSFESGIYFISFKDIEGAVSTKKFVKK